MLQHLHASSDRTTASLVEILPLMQPHAKMILDGTSKRALGDQDHVRAVSYAWVLKKTESQGILWVSNGLDRAKIDQEVTALLRFNIESLAGENIDQVALDRRRRRCKFYPMDLAI